MSAVRVALVLWIAVVPLGAQDLGSQLRQFDGGNAESYLRPVLSAWGATLNSGFSHSAAVHGPLGFDLQVKASLARVPAGERTFRFRMPDQISVGGQVLQAGIDYPLEVETGTFVGSEEETVVRSYAGAEVLRIPGGLDLETVPLVMPQVAIGLPFGVEVLGRFLPTTSVGEGASVNLQGFGLRYDLAQHLPFLPLDLALSFVTQKLGIQDATNTELMRASGLAFGMMVSKELPLLTVYGGLQLEGTSWTIAPYSARVPAGPGQSASIAVGGFSVEGANTARAIVGARLQLGMITAHVDYSLGEWSAVTFGGGLTFE